MASARGRATSPTDPLQEALSRLRAVLALERKQGFCDRAVIGGLAKFAQHWERTAKEQGFCTRLPDPVASLASTVATYAALTPSSRKTLVAGIEAVLAGKPPTVQGEGLRGEVRYLPGIGERRAERLRELGIDTVHDLLYCFPLRHEDRTQLQPLRRATEGERVCVSVTVTDAGSVERRRGLRITRVPVEDQSGEGFLTWFNQDYMASRFQPGEQVLASGTCKWWDGYPTVNVQEYEQVGSSSALLQMGRIIPVYALTRGLTQLALRKATHSALARWAAEVPDALPAEMRERLALVPVQQALEQVHYPSDSSQLEQARRRLVFEELFLLQTAFLRRIPSGPDARQGPRMPGSQQAARQFTSALPFPLTSAQSRVLDELLDELEEGRQMNRLLQGDVGSGKTVIAATLAFAASRAGYQCAFMAPTEVLAMQHFLVLSEFLANTSCRLALLMGSLPPREKEQVRSAVREGKTAIVVGTHALIQDMVDFPRMGLAIIDEQHRFGVAQRARLREKGGACHLLVMTATPIPRTLTLTVYGDLDLSVLDELPPGRKPVETSLVGRSQAYQEVRAEVTRGGQAYVVCPAIEDSEKMELTAVTQLAQELSTGALAGCRLAVLHGRMGREEKARVMKRFREARTEVLVSTTVIEVGVDVPNASLMVIEDADRYGLAQLHQLRGRVGRGVRSSRCLLISSSRARQARERLRLVATTHDGFQIAEFDLLQRGPGEFFGHRQSGLPDLRIANVIEDVEILRQAREEARRLLERDPQLALPEHANLAAELAARTRPRLPMVDRS